MDAKRLEKLFRMLGTAGDGEALAALYAIRRHIGEGKGDWHKFVNQLVAVEFGIDAMPAFRARRTQPSRDFYANTTTADEERVKKGFEEILKRTFKAADEARQKAARERYAKTARDAYAEEVRESLRKQAGRPAGTWVDEPPDGETQRHSFFNFEHGSWWEQERVWKSDSKEWQTVYDGPQREHRRFEQAMDGINARFKKMQGEF